MYVNNYIIFLGPRRGSAFVCGGGGGVGRGRDVELIKQTCSDDDDDDDDGDRGYDFPGCDGVGPVVVADFVKGSGRKMKTYCDSGGAAQGYGISFGPA